MLTFIGLSVAWIIGTILIAMFIKISVLKSSGNDSFTAFSQGFAFGPVGIMAAFGPMTNTNNRGSMALGGVVGTIAFIYVFTSL